jgi:lysine 6-dehydrogenase
MRVKGIGRTKEAVVELIDRYDEETGFLAMQRLTGWHASIVAILAARGEVEKGVVPVELAVPGSKIVEEARKRGLDIKEKV